MSLLTVFVKKLSGLSTACLVQLESSQLFGTEICSNVEAEPHLQLLSGECLDSRKSIRGDEVRLVISANGVWVGIFEKAFFDVRVFNLCAK